MNNECAMGKISVKHYLNKKVKPSYEFHKDGLIEAYRLYYYITVRRKTIHKPSIIGIDMTEDVFEGREWNDNRRVQYGCMELNDLLNAESDLIKSIVGLYEREYEEGKVKTAYRGLADRKFASKDEYINDLNAYIDFYSKSVLELISSEAIKTSYALFEGEEVQLHKRLGKFAKMVTFKPAYYANEEGIEAYTEAFGVDKVLSMYSEVLLEIAEKTMEEIFIGVSVYDWQFGKAKDILWDFIYKLRMLKGKDRINNEYILNMTREQYDKGIVREIDRVCSAEYRVETMCQEMKPGL